ncbi:MAG TPA: guanylate kinase [Bacteroidales bacterium]|nr:guanylate kinase [Bacteroidales bacterium]
MKCKLFIFSAPSGSGKTSIVRYLLDLGLNFEFSISATSRKPRDGEEDGIDYYFLSAADFREKITNNEFIEWEEVYTDHYYGTLRSEIERIRGKGNHVLFDVDVAGGLNLKRLYGDSAVSFFVKPPSVDVLRQRLKKRGTDSGEKIEMRIAKAELELEKSSHFDHIIINDDLEKACLAAEKIVRDIINE